MIINVHAGHGREGLKNTSIGAIGRLHESICDREIKDVVIQRLRQDGHTVYDCTVDSGSQNTILKNIVKKCNAHTVDIDVSIHLNAGGGTGSEVWVYPGVKETSYCETVSKRILSNLSHLGLSNRGVKYSKDLYVLSKTKSPAILVEACFVNDDFYYSATKIGEAIANGIVGHVIGLSKKEHIQENYQKDTGYCLNTERVVYSESINSPKYKTKKILPVHTWVLNNATKRVGNVIWMYIGTDWVDGKRIHQWIIADDGVNQFAYK